MAGDLKQYDADEINISIAGIPLSGYADGKFLDIARDSDAFGDTVGTDGEVTRNKNKDDRATITVRLMQTSDSNDLLSALYNSDKNTPGGVGVGPFLARDNIGRAAFSAEKSWIAASPPVAFDRGPVEREWKIRVATLVEKHGGS